MENNKIPRNYYIAQKSKDLPNEIEDGAIYYVKENKQLLIDIDNERNVINEQMDSVTKNILSDLQDSIYWIKAEEYGSKSGDYYGVQWNYDDPSTKLTRIGAAKNFADPSPATSVNESGSSPFDNIYPWCDMKEVNITQDYDRIIERDDPDFSYNNDTMVWIPEFYYKVEKDETAKTHSWSISGTELEGFKKHPGSGKYVSKYHIGYYPEAQYSLASITGLTPYMLSTAQDFRYALSHGHWRMLDIYVWSALQMLYLVEFADWDSQEALGTGWAINNESDNQLELGVCGGTDNAAYHTIKASEEHNQYRYIEDIYSNLNDFVDGLGMSDNGYIYISNDPSLYTLVDNHSEYDLYDSNINTGIKVSGEGHPIEFAYNNYCDCMFIPINFLDVDTVDYVPDRAYIDNNNDGFKKQVLVGGSVITASVSGMFLLWIVSEDILYASREIYTTRLIYDESVTIEDGGAIK